LLGFNAGGKAFSSHSRETDLLEGKSLHFKNLNSVMQSNEQPISTKEDPFEAFSLEMFFNND
jgi:hypothetical protein